MILLQRPKIFFTHKRNFRTGLSCDGMFVDIQCRPLEIFAIKKPYFFLFWNSCVTWLIINAINWQSRVKLPKLLRIVS